jgi:hypothetical protein
MLFCTGQSRCREAGRLIPYICIQYFGGAWIAVHAPGVDVRSELVPDKKWNCSRFFRGVFDEYGSS